MTRLKPLETYPDRLVDLAFNARQAPLNQKLESFYDLAADISEMVVANWQPDSQLLVSSFRASAFLSTLPSLENVARSEPQTIDTAREVSDRFKHLSQKILAKELIYPIASRGRQNPVFRGEINGQMAEIGVLGVIWWGIAHEKWPEKTYALPATRKQDAKRLKDGYSLATDIIVRESGPKKRQLI